MGPAFAADGDVDVDGPAELAAADDDTGDPLVGAGGGIAADAAANAFEYCCISKTAASNNCWMFCKHCNRAVTPSRAWLSNTRSSSSLKFAKREGGRGGGIAEEIKLNKWH